VSDLRFIMAVLFGPVAITAAAFGSSFTLIAMANFLGASIDGTGGAFGALTMLLGALLALGYAWTLNRIDWRGP